VPRRSVPKKALIFASAANSLMLTPPSREGAQELDGRDRPFRWAFPALAAALRGQLDQKRKRPPFWARCELFERNARRAEFAENLIRIGFHAVASAPSQSSAASVSGNSVRSSAVLQLLAQLTVGDGVEHDAWRLPDLLQHAFHLPGGSQDAHARSDAPLSSVSIG
jgi:hypothetical protein